MPDQFGNPTAEDVRALIRAEADLKRSRAGNVFERNTANLDAMIKMASLGQDPRYAKATKIEEVMRGAQQATRNEGESALDYEQRVMGKAYRDMKSVDPTAAAGIQKRLIEIENEQTERNRLATVMKATDLANRKNERLLAKDEALGRYDYVVDLSTRKGIGTVDTNAPLTEQEQALAGMGLGENPNLVRVTWDEYLQINEDNDSLLKDRVNKSTIEKRVQLVDNAVGFIETAQSLVDVLEEARRTGTDPLADLVKADVALSRGGSSLDEMSRRLSAKGGPVDDVGDTQGEAQAWLENNVKNRARLSNVSLSLFTRLAYMNALAFNDRVTDKDFEAAWDMLGGKTGRAEDAVAALKNQINLTMRTAVDPLRGELAGEYTPYSEQTAGFLRDKVSRADGVYKKWEDTSSVFQKSRDVDPRSGTGITPGTNPNQQVTSSGIRFTPREIQ